MEKNHLIRDHDMDQLHSRKSCPTYVCESCGKWTHLTLGELHRRSMKRCQSCGGFLRETENARKKRGGKTPRQLTWVREHQHVCRWCGCKLRSGNTTNYCALHEDATKRVGESPVKKMQAKSEEEENTVEKVESSPSWFPVPGSGWELLKGTPTLRKGDHYWGGDKWSRVGPDHWGKKLPSAFIRRRLTGTRKASGS